MREGIARLSLLRNHVESRTASCRSFGVRVLLEELKADYDVRAIDLKAGDQRRED
jgi:glutathione S-transferase